MSFFDLLPNGDWDNDGWTLAGTGVTKLFEALNNTDDAKFAKSPASKGGATVSFPIDISTADIPEGAVVTSVSVWMRARKTSTDPYSLTVQVPSKDDTSKFTSRVFHNLTTTASDHEVATYTRDALGLPWDRFTLNNLLFRVFSHAGVFDAIRIFRFFFRVHYRLRPTVTVQQPSGVVTTPSPVISWTYRQSLGDKQLRADYKIFTAAERGAVTFNPNTTPPTFAATVIGDVSSVTLPTSLNADTYYVYVRVWSAFFARSLWAWRSFTVQGPSPGVPAEDSGTGVVSVIPDSQRSSAALAMRDLSNLLSVQQASFETTTDALEYTTSNCAVERDTSVFFGAGKASLKATASTAATMSVASTLVEIDPAAPVTVRAQVRAATTGRTVNVSARFYDESFTLLGGAVTVAGSDTTGTWTSLKATGTTHADARYADVQVEVVTPGASEVHNVDRVGLMYGTDTAWSHGGHMSRNLLSAYQSTADTPSGSGWEASNVATTLAQPSTTGTGSHGLLTQQMTYIGTSPSIAHRATSATWTSPTSGIDYTLEKPAGTAEDDLLVAFVASEEHGSINPPAGWTTVNTSSVDDGSTDTALWILKRTATASEPANWSDGTLDVSSTRRSAVVIAYSGAADASEQFIADGVRMDATGNFVHTTASLENTDENAWRITAFAARDSVSGGAFTANEQPPSDVEPVEFVGKASRWSTTSNTASYTVNRPSGVQSGDLMIASVGVKGSVTVTAPSGWTVVKQAVQADGFAPCTLAVLKRTAGSSEPSSWSGSLSASARPILTQAQAYRHCKDASLQFLGDATSTDDSGTTITTATVNNTQSSSWRVCAFAATDPDASNWSSTEARERSDDSVQYPSGGWFSSPDYAVTVSMADSDGVVSTGNHTRQGTLSESYFAAVSWIGLIEGLDTPPTPPADETQRADFTNGSADPWLTLAVFDSAAVVPLGDTSVTGVMSNSSSEADSLVSWIGLVKPAAPAVTGAVAANLVDTVDISKIDPWVLHLADNKVTVSSSFLGSTPGTAYLTMSFYRGIDLLLTESREGASFDTSTWLKSSATFDMPTGTTHMRPQVEARDRAINDTVSFDRVSLSLGDSSAWRNGTGRTEHPVWAIPEIQYQEDSGTGYGDWAPIPGASLNPAVFDPLTGVAQFQDHSITPLVRRRYRAQTISYGLSGDQFVSGFGPASEEVAVAATDWWLKDLELPDNSMKLKVKAELLKVGTTNTTSVYQPLGEDLPVVVSEGYKGETFELEVIVDRAQYASLRKLLQARKTLWLQSNQDHAWWVRSIGDLAAETQQTWPTSNPLRFVSLTFVQVAAPVID